MIVAAVLLAALAAVAPPAGTVYETATVRARPLDAATGAVTVVERETLETAGATSAAEALAFVPGVTVLSGGPRPSLAAAQVRGGDPNFTLVLVDGVPVNDGTYPVGEVFDLGALPLAAVERVEVVRGPLSAHYGSTGLAGAVQLVTRRGDGPLAAEVAAGAGDARYRRAAATLGGGDGDADGFLAVVGEGEEGRVAAERHELVHLQGRTRRRLGERTTLAVAGRLAGREADDYPDGSGGPVHGSGELRRSEHEEGGLALRLDLGDAAARLAQRLDVAVYRHDADRASPAIGFAVPASVESTRFVRARAGWAATRAGEDLQWSVGASVDREEGENASTLFLPDVLGGAVAGDYALARTTPGVYAEVVARRGRLTAEAGLRADFPEGGDEEASPRLGVAWRPGDGTTRLRASLGRAFKLPSFFAVASPPALGGNPDLRPETSWGADAGWSRRFGGTVDVDVTVFAQRYTDLVDFDFATFTHVNRSRVDARGVEAALAWRPAGDWSAAAAVGWQDVEDAATGEPLRHRPRWSGTLWATWRPSASVDLHADLRFASSSRDEQVPVPAIREVDGHALAGLAAAWRPAPRWRLALRVDNLADERYETLVGFPGPGRGVRLDVRCTAGRRR